MCVCVEVGCVWGELSQGTVLMMKLLKVSLRKAGRGTSRLIVYVCVGGLLLDSSGCFSPSGSSEESDGFSS